MHGLCRPEQLHVGRHAGHKERVEVVRRRERQQKREQAQGIFSLGTEVENVVEGESIPLIDSGEDDEEDEDGGDDEDHNPGLSPTELLEVERAAIEEANQLLSAELQAGHISQSEYDQLCVVNQRALENNQRALEVAKEAEEGERQEGVSDVGAETDT